MIELPHASRSGGAGEIERMAGCGCLQRHNRLDDIRVVALTRLGNFGNQSRHVIIAQYLQHTPDEARLQCRQIALQIDNAPVRAVGVNKLKRLMDAVGA